MAAKKKLGAPRRYTVPVTSRTAAVAEPTAAQQRGRGGSRAAKVRGPWDIASYAVMLAVLIVVLLAVNLPLRNFYAGRAEIARLEESIAAKEAEKAQLQADIARLSSDDYARELARARLGVIEPGEIAYRIIDPRMSHDSSVTTDRAAERESRPWFGVLWDSVAVEPEDVGVEPELAEPAADPAAADPATDPAADNPSAAEPAADPEAAP